ncbi:Putative EG45-like domain containing protein 1 [Striga hermonthica]|uniref:EG45-like domain containing protein 1 n=1 Tax=Striga hermonthica TaxID=68872 RepID=A0A9N7NW25_STRHE|nr:Putative EG45-like domain containing protein 1 [Striga hermonthica]
MAIERVLILALIGTCLISMASAIPGQATFYTPPYVPSACYGFTEQGTLIAAANPTIYANGAACGRRYRIRCTGRTNLGVLQPCTNREIIVRVVDLCPGCAADQFDLSREAFAMIANPDAGRIFIDYAQV